MNDTEQDTAYEDFIKRRRHTRPCKYFQTGACWNTAEECRWAHVYYRTSGDPWQRPCKYYLEGFCARGQYCEFLHGNDPSRYNLTPPGRQMNLHPLFLGGCPPIYPARIPFHSLDYNHDSDNSYPSDNYPPSDPETSTTDEIMLENGSHFDSDTDRALPTPKVFIKPILRKKDPNMRYKKHADKNPRVVVHNSGSEDSIGPHPSRRRAKASSWRVISGGVIVGTTSVNRRSRKATADIQVEEVKEITYPAMPQRQTVPTVGLQLRRAKPVDLKITAPPARPSSAPPTTATSHGKPRSASSVFAAEA